ncbi:UNVERIFIED_CONTAM: hypothetical protein RMT77_006533 [Armadillidium vulgare]
MRSCESSKKNPCAIGDSGKKGKKNAAKEPSDLPEVSIDTSELDFPEPPEFEEVCAGKVHSLGSRCSLKKAKDALAKDAQFTKTKAKASKKDTLKVEGYAKQLRTMAAKYVKKAEDSKCQFERYSKSVQKKKSSVTLNKDNIG